MKMEIAKNELLTMLEEYRELELRNIKKCQEQEEQIKSTGAKLMLFQIRMDSAKHAHILQNLIDMVKIGETEYLWDYKIDRNVDQISVEKVLQEHINMEQEMIKRCHGLITKTDNVKLKAVLQLLIEEEKIHEKLLTDVVKQVSAPNSEKTP